ncbi:short chain dehydrogenase [Gloeobacter kilaueensis JS1]|uniref:Short chain dehydrogenase n=1 Tax=Gloeobacter kilaueensis (strain ATCC BAA-2537 / CCAP 1431/1 / ULC 316 / JS1) TaxID=1183438 RepID=U5QJF9_GLOK1|nr:SDR family oxidoreductase [Gloeobacter kilaueensis]AGY59051.1 short chain dehydrogenase [Gloeobacter kilaueensis JS1]
MQQIRLKPLAQQVVVVFGASSGIGRETALRLAQKDAKLVVAARTESALVSLVETIRAQGGQAVYQLADAARIDEVQAVAERAIVEYGRLDTWVQVAGTAVIGPFLETTAAEFERVVQVNLLGQVYGAMAALPHLKRQGGALIHISSVEARRSMPLQSAYAASKHGIEGFLDSLRLELEHDRLLVSVTNILPGVINTPFYNKALTKLGVKPSSVPPFYQPGLVADAILFAAEHPVRELIVGDAGRVLDYLQRLSPALTDRLLQLVGFKFQYTDQIEGESAPNNLFEPIEGDNRTEGDYRQLTIPSFFDWLDRYPGAKWALGGAAVAAVALLAAGQSRRGE